MTASIFAVAVLVCAAQAGAQQCALDPNGNGVTAINELILAVNQALTGCPGSGAPTPTRRLSTPTPTPQPQGGCPFQFNDAVDDDFCIYRGDLTSPGCRTEFDRGAGWYTEGTQVVALIVVDDDLTIALTGRRTSPTMASVTSWSLGPDYEVEIPTTGQLRLNSSSRFTSNFDSDTDCGVISYDGDFLTRASANAQQQVIHGATVRSALRSHPGPSAAGSSQSLGGDADATERRARLRRLREQLLGR